MKLFKLFFTASLFLCLMSCSDDDSSTPDEGFVGEWTVTGIDYSGTSTTVTSDGQTASGSFVGTGVDMDLQIKFEENPMNYSTSGDYGIELEVDFGGGQTSTIPYSNQGFVGAGTWAQVGDNLIIVNDNGDEESIEIVSMTSNEIVLGWGSNIIQTTPDFTSTISLDGTYTFERN